MSYLYERFGAITLPTYNREHGLAPVGPRARLVATVAGSFDGDGAARSAQQFPHPLTLEAIVAETSTATQRDALDALRAAVGTRAYLYRRADDDSSVQRALCRLTGMSHERQYKQRTGYQPIKLQFQQLGPWLGTIYSGPWYLDQGYEFDAGYVLDSTTTTYTMTESTPVFLVIAGNLPITDIVVTATVTTGVLTGFGCNGATWSWAWYGSVTAGRTLQIDTAAESVLLDGGSAYSGFRLQPSHVIERWVDLTPAANQIYVTLLGGTGLTVKLTIEYSDRWA